MFIALVACALAFVCAFVPVAAHADEGFEKLDASKLTQTDWIYDDAGNDLSGEFTSGELAGLREFLDATGVQPVIVQASGTVMPDTGEIYTELFDDQGHILVTFVCDRATGSASLSVVVGSDARKVLDQLGEGVLQDELEIARTSSLGRYSDRMPSAIADAFSRLATHTLEESSSSDQLAFLASLAVFMGVPLVCGTGYIVIAAVDVSRVRRADERKQRECEALYMEQLADYEIEKAAYDEQMEFVRLLDKYHEATPQDIPEEPKAPKKPGVRRTLD